MVFAGDRAHCAVAIPDHPANIRQTFRIDPAGDYGSEAMSSSSSRRLTGVKPCRT
jgi:hypothetical protein